MHDSLARTQTDAFCRTVTRFGWINECYGGCCQNMIPGKTIWVRQLHQHVLGYVLIILSAVGAVSEAKHQLESFGRMAFGGAGLSISDALGAKLYNLWDTCWTNWKHIFGGTSFSLDCSSFALLIVAPHIVIGDEMITRCAALATSTTKQTVTTLEPGLHRQ